MPRTFKTNCNTKTKIDHGRIRNRYARFGLDVRRLIHYTTQQYKARNTTCPLARDKRIFRRTTKIANIVVRRTTWIAAGSVTRQRSSDFGVRF